MGQNYSYKHSPSAKESPGCGEIGSGKFPMSTCLENLRVFPLTTTYISLHFCINKNRTGIIVRTILDSNEFFRVVMMAASVLVSSSLRKLVNKSSSFIVVVPSLCFINTFFQIINLFLIHLCLILLVFFIWLGPNVAIWPQRALTSVSTLGLPGPTETKYAYASVATFK